VDAWRVMLLVPGCPNRKRPCLSGAMQVKPGRATEVYNRLGKGRLDLGHEAVASSHSAMLSS
jgi:hypothetical protein